MDIEAKMNFLQAHYCRLIMVLILFLQLCPLFETSFGVFSSSKNQGKVADFSLEPLNNGKGTKSLERARERMALAPSDSCWQRAYNNLLSGCATALADVESRSKFAFDLTDCFVQQTGREKLPKCDPKSPVKECLREIDEQYVNYYLEFQLETNNICYQLQVTAFQEQTEKLINDLISASKSAGIKLENIGEQGEKQLRKSEKLGESLTSLDKQSQELAGISKDVQARSSDLFHQSKMVYDQFIGIASSQMELAKGQKEMKGNLEKGMAALLESYNSLGKGMETLKNQTVGIHKEIIEIGAEMYSKMNNLQRKTEDIDRKAEITLGKQEKILVGQSQALDNVQDLTESHSEALKTSREAIEKMAEFRNKYHEENLRMRGQLQESHDTLVESSKNILAAQEAFESKQSSMFDTVSQMLSVLNMIQLESRLLNAFLFYLFVIILIQIFTSTRQTSDARRMIHLHWVGAFSLDCLVCWYGFNTYWWVIIYPNRSFFVIVSAYKIVGSYFTYCDYVKEDHERLIRLEQFQIERRRKRMYSGYDSDDSEISSWSSWLGSCLPSSSEDSSYRYSGEEGEEVTSKRYNLRKRY